MKGNMIKGTAAAGGGNPGYLGTLKTMRGNMIKGTAAAGGGNPGLTAVKKKQPKWKKKAKAGIHKFSKFLTVIVAAIQLLDFSFASLETQNFLGSGQAFKNTVREAHEFVTSIPGISQSSLVPKENYGPEVLSKFGHLMLEQMGTSPDDYNWGSVGYFDTSKSTAMDMCKKFKGSFHNIPTTNARLVLFRETVSLIKPLSLGNPADVSLEDNHAHGNEDEEGEDSHGHGDEDDSHDAAPADSHDTAVDDSHDTTSAPADSHDTAVDSHDTAVDSHDAVVDSHDAPSVPVDSHDAVDDSNDAAPADSHDAVDDSHDTAVDDSHDAAPADSHDAVDDSHDTAVDDSHDAAPADDHGHGAEEDSHDAAVDDNNDAEGFVIQLSHSQLHVLEEAGGYYGARRGLDIRLTDRIDFGNLAVGATGSAHVSALKHFAKSFCDGCIPMAELGSFHCEIDYTVTKSNHDGTIDIEVTKAANEAGSYHNLGLAYPSTDSGRAEFIFKVFLIIWLSHVVLYSISGAIKSQEAQTYLASRASPEDEGKTINNALLNTKRNFFLEWLLPQHFRTGESTFSIGFIMYNSDFIVFTQALFTCASLIQSLNIQREVLWWYKLDPTFRSFVTRTAVNGRIMWIYLALFKGIKAVYLRLRGPEKAKKMIFHNNFFVVIFIANLFALDQMLDIFFSNRVDVENNPITASNTAVHVFDGFYVQRLPMVFVHTVLSVVIFSTVLQILERFLGKQVEDVSFYEIFAGSHLTVLWDPDMAQVLPHRTGRSLLFMPIGTLMNLKWFMKTNLITLSTNVRKRKYAMETAEDSSGTNSYSRASNEGQNNEERKKRRAAEESNVFCRLTNDGNVDIKSVNDAASFIVVEQTTVFYKWIKANSRIKIH